MRRLITNILATSALALTILAFIMLIVFPLYDVVFSITVLTIVGANIVVHVGLLITKKFESKYLILELLLDVTYTAVVLIIFGIIFDWADVTPIWALILMAALIHLVVFFLNMSRNRKEAKKINELLMKRSKDKLSNRSELKNG